MLKHLLIALSLLPFLPARAQTSDTTFKKEWIEIDTLIINQNLPKTALEKVNALYKKANAKQLEVQLIKCLIYRISLEQRVADKKNTHAITVLENEIGRTTNEAAKSILYSLLASRYLDLYNQNRYIIFRRSKTANFKKEDVETWDADDYGNAISSNFAKSLANAKLLQQAKLVAYDAIILQGNARKLRPTLYDLLAHEALAYFKSGEYYLTKPAYAFELNDINALAPAKTFLQTTFTTKDSTSHLLKSLELFKALIQFHWNDEDKNALIDIDLERIKWVYTNLTNENKEEQYKLALEPIAQYSYSRASQAHFLLAEQEANNAKKYAPFGDTANRFADLAALKIIDNALVKYKVADEGIINMKRLKNDILSQLIAIQTEKVNIPNKPFRALVSYKNVDTLFARLIKVDKSNDSIYNTWGVLTLEHLTKQKILKSFVQPLPQTNDHQTHAVEIKIDALPVGEYVLLTSSGKGFIDTLNKLSYQTIYVSNISYIKNGADYFVLNRETGEPLENVKVQISQEQWNATKQKNEFGIIGEKITDKNGLFSVTVKEYFANYRFSFTSANDKLQIRTQEYLNTTSESSSDKGNYYENKAALYENDRTAVYFFTDRRIYRPGQTVYFKGIAITKDYVTEQNKVIANKGGWKVYLQDVNSKNTDSLILTSNEFGSFNGTFKVPQNVLTGSFSIVTDKGRADISVEEYKRPKFYVSFEKVKGSYRLDDSVTVVGTAKAFSGNSIDGAKVKFNVQRNARFVYAWLSRGRPTPSSNKQISNGEIVTDAEGKFKITFKASADEKVNKNTDPLFDFSITADVTDPTGETRSSSTQLTVGYKSLVLNVNIASPLEADNFKGLGITAKNLSNEDEPADVTVKIYPLQTPQRLIRRSLWQRADQFVMSRETYISNFPNDDYADELNENLWEAGKLVFEGKMNTKESFKIQLPTTTYFKPGHYKIEATAKDKFGNEVKDVKFIQLFSKSAMPYAQYNFIYQNNKFVEPNDTARFISGSMAEKIFMVRRTLTQHSPTTTKIITQNKGLHNLEIIPLEKDRGNILISDAFVINNRVYTNQYYANVPFSNKQLNVTYTSFRNKTEPGNKETWTINIKGNKGEKVTAELLTGMYDASLDEYASNDWSEPDIWIGKSLNSYFQTDAAFGAASSNGNYLYKKEKYMPLVYDRLVKNSSQLHWIQPLWWDNSLKYKNRHLNPLVNNTDMAYASADQLELSAGWGGGEGLTRSMGTQNDLVIRRELRTVPGEKFSKDGLLESQRKTGGFDFDMNANVSMSMKAGALPYDALQEEDYNKVFSAVESIDPVTGERTVNGRIVNGGKKNPPVQPRKNFNETAFFFPNLYADTAGNYTFSFTMPEALTKWKWLSFAHTKDLSFGGNDETITTQKTLMVQPNAPRFMREGDNMEFVAKVSNMSDKELTGQATLELVDAVTGKSVDGWFQNAFPNQYFTVGAGQSAAVKFPMQIPFNYNKPLTWRVVARAGDFSDGEENTLPVLTNRMLVTETLPLYLKAAEKEKSFTFDKLLNNKSESLTHESITVEYTANPIWSVVQSLPYLMEYPYECAEQTFNRFYANALAASITNKHPNIKMMFEKWKNDTSALKSNLQTNEELKQVLLQETPWVLNAENEEQQKKNIALLFDVAKMGNSMESVIEKLKQMQLPSGGFAWFKGGREDRYITNYILTGMGKLKKINALPKQVDDKLVPLITSALRYLDARIADDYNGLVKNKIDLKKDNISSTAIQYLYMRSFYADSKVNEGITTAKNYYYNQAKQFWNKQNSYHAAMIGLVLYRNNERRLVNVNILPSIIENAVEDTAKGTLYWKDRNTCFWYASPIEHQSMMIDFLGEVQKQDNPVGLLQKVDAAKTWLILNKQTNNWKTTVATADACYALLNTGSNWRNNNQQVQITLGNLLLTSSKGGGTEPTPNYFKQRINGDKVKTSMGNILVSTTYSLTSSTSNSSPLGRLGGPSYGSIYWQYFEDLDKITEASSPLSIKKKIFIERNSDKGKVLALVSDTNQLKVGDKLVVRMELRSDREMEYLHLKDMRASGTEPINVLSGYKWQEGLGYYEATKDASTNFFIDKMQKGTYIFEYPLYITHTGTFSVGIATIQCMYAPEFTSHSEGIKITVK